MILYVRPMLVFSHKVLRSHNPEERKERGTAMIVQGALVMFSPCRGAQILQEDRVEIVADGIDRGSYDTDMRVDAADCHSVKAVRSQGLVKVGLEESAEPPFGEDDVSCLRREVMQHLFASRTPYGVRLQFTLEDEVFFQKTVIGEYHGDRKSPASFQKGLHGLNDLLLLPLSMPGLTEAIFKHVDYDDGRIHELLLPLTNRLMKLSQRTGDTSSTGLPRDCAICVTTRVTNAGSFRFPRCGSGVRNGASVSGSMRSRGMYRTISRREDALLYVTVPGIER